MENFEPPLPDDLAEVADRIAAKLKPEEVTKRAALIKEAIANSDGQDHSRLKRAIFGLTADATDEELEAAAERTRQ